MIIKIALNKIIRVALMLFFRFEPWHTSPSDNRSYPGDIVRELRRRKVNGSVLEVGCGLGDIIGKISCREKYFFDLSERVLRAAKFLQGISFSRSSNHYQAFDFLTEEIEKDIRIDAAIFVNWIHGFEASGLRKRIGKIVSQNLKPGGVLVFDVIENNSSYKFNHSIEELIEPKLFQIDTTSGYKFGRRLVYARLK